MGMSATVLRPNAARGVGLATALSVVIALLMAGGALAGLLAPSRSYPDGAMRDAFVANDLATLLIGLPALVGAPLLARRGGLLGLLCWPGALLFATYNAIAYAVALPSAAQIGASLALAALSVAAIVALLGGFDAAAIRARLRGAVPARAGGIALVGLGLIFLLRAIGLGVRLLGGQAALGAADTGALAADLLITPWWVVGGVLLWREHPLGYAVGAGLLCQASLLFAGLLVALGARPLVAATPFPIADFLVIAALGPVCFVPFALFARGTLRRAPLAGSRRAAAWPG